jgi:CRP/FNR family cyclic AMP-dependent transcriptional regulator
MAVDPDTLRRTPAFGVLPREAREAMALCFRERRYALGEIVFREGEPAASLLFVVEGELTVTVRAGGAPRPLARVGPGQLLGEAALIDHTPRDSTVAAARASAVYEIGEDSLEVLRRASPAAARALTGVAIAGVARRLRQLEQRLEQELER